MCACMYVYVFTHPAHMFHALQRKGEQLTEQIHGDIVATRPLNRNK